MRTSFLGWLGTGLFTAAFFSVAVIPEAEAGLKANPFEPIVQRNPFSLKPAPPAVEPPAPVAPPAPLAVVEVTGLLSILSSPRALLEIVPGPGKPMLKPILGVGERVDAVEVVSINVERGEVVLKNGSVVTNVPLKIAKSGPTPTPNAIPTVAKPSVQPTGASPAGGRNSVTLGGGAAPVVERPQAPVPPSLPIAGRFAQPPNPAVR